MSTTTDADTGQRPQVRTRRFGGLVTFIFCLLLVGLVNAATRHPETGVRWYAGSVGQPVTTPLFTVLVDQVATAQRVSATGRVRATEGVFLLVGLDVSANEQELSSPEIELHTRSGLALRDRVEFAEYAPTAVQPGFTAHGAVVFQVHPDDLPGAELRFEYMVSGPMDVYTSGVVIRGLTDDLVDTLEQVDIQPVVVEVTPR